MPGFAAAAKSSRGFAFHTSDLKGGVQAARGQEVSALRLTRVFESLLLDWRHYPESSEEAGLAWHWLSRALWKHGATKHGTARKEGMEGTLVFLS